MKKKAGLAALRPFHFLLVLLLLLSLLNFWMYAVVHTRQLTWEKNASLFALVTEGLGLTDLCLATEARYTRHPAVSDQVVPFMDHPGSIEHFPTGSFWAPPPRHTSFEQKGQHLQIRLQEKQQ